MWETAYGNHGGSLISVQFQLKDLTNLQNCGRYVSNGKMIGVYSNLCVRVG